MRRVALLLLAGVTGCKVAGDSFISTDAGLELTEVARFPMTPNDDIDVLFVVDNSPDAQVFVNSMVAGSPLFFANLLTTRNFLPNLHIGLVTTDLGTRGAYDPSVADPVGSGPGTCSGIGNSGTLSLGMAMSQVSGGFVSDIRNSDGTRTVNYTGVSLPQLFIEMLQLGGQGCAYGQPMEAARRALGPSINPGFIRPGASLAVVFATNRDDCSFKSSTFFTGAAPGTLSQFRCTQYGVSCDYRGATSEEMGTVGDKASCHSNENGLLVPVSDYTTFFHGVKRDEMLAMRVIAGLPSPLSVQPGNATPAQLQPLCGSGIDAVPAIRLDQLADGVGGRRTLDACSPGSNGYEDQMKSLALQLSGLTGRTCLDREIAPSAECVVAVDHTAIPACGNPPCYTRDVPDTQCPFGAVQVAPTSPGSWVTMRCRI